MTTRLDVKQIVALTKEDRAAIRAEAARRNVGNGLLARALIIYGLEHLGDPQLDTVIDQEAAEEKTRISEAARENVAQRWRTATEGETP